MADEERRNYATQTSRFKNRKKSRPAAVPRSTRAGLVLPVGRCHRFLRDSASDGQVVGATAAAYATGVLEYVIAEVLSLAGDICIKEGNTSISPKNLKDAVEQDEELTNLVKDTLDFSEESRSQDGESEPQLPRRTKRVSVKPERFQSSVTLRVRKQKRKRLATKK